MTKKVGPCGGSTALLVEDDEGVRRSLQLLLHWKGYEVRSYSAATPLLAAADLDSADVLIADYRLPDATGCDVRLALSKRGWSGRSVLITGFHSEELAAQARAIGFDAVLDKPLRQQALIAILAQPIRRLPNVPCTSGRTQSLASSHRSRNDEERAAARTR